MGRTGGPLAPLVRVGFGTRARASVGLGHEGDERDVVGAGGAPRLREPGGSCRSGTVCTVQELLALVAFSFVSAVTPGPNNVLLWASGVAFGTRRTLRHVLGTSLGIGLMALGAAAGLAALIEVLPGIAVAMRVVGSGYLLWLAWQIARSGAVREGVLAQPMGVRGAIGFQLVNPKAWVFALGAVTTFRPADVPPVPGTLAMAAVMMVVVLPSALTWAVAGGAMARLLVDERRRGLVTGVLAVLVVATVALVWV
jgi:threonine/homoserine/homoserine lactone efflux protein